ncbi:MAG: NAD(P)-dependent oxidoreductase [Pseudomonadota bacterium]
MKNILITGASGFIGSALKTEIENSIYNVLTFNSSDGDISQTNLADFYGSTDIDHIFHLAAKTFVPKSWVEPIEFYRTSIMGTQQVLELCREKKISLTYVSSYLYGTPEKLPISETHRIKPNNPYSHSKYLTEELCKFYSEYFDVKITIIRPFNIFGHNQDSNFLIPHIINQVKNSDVIKVKDLEPKRDYIFMDDLIWALKKTINIKKNFSVFNLGSGHELSVQQIIDVIQKVANTDKKVISENIQRRNEINSVVADITKAKNELDWHPRYDFEQGIRKIFLELERGNRF